MNEERIAQLTDSTNAISIWSNRLLAQMGVGEQWINYVNSVLLLVILSILIFTVYYITRFILRNVFKKMSAVPKMAFFKYLSDRKFPHYLSIIIPFSLVKASIPIVFGIFPKFMGIAYGLAEIYLIFYIIWLVMSVINAFGDSVKTRPQLKDKPIDSYIQVVQIVFYFVGFIFLFSIPAGFCPVSIENRNMNPTK